MVPSEPLLGGGGEAWRTDTAHGARRTGGERGASTNWCDCSCCSPLQHGLSRQRACQVPSPSQSASRASTWNCRPATASEKGARGAEFAGATPSSGTALGQTLTMWCARGRRPTLRAAGLPKPVWAIMIPSEPFGGAGALAHDGSGAGASGLAASERVGALCAHWTFGLCGCCCCNSCCCCSSCCCSS